MRRLETMAALPETQQQKVHVCYWVKEIARVKRASVMWTTFEIREIGKESSCPESARNRMQVV